MIKEITIGDMIPDISMYVTMHTKNLEADGVSVYEKVRITDIDHDILEAFITEGIANIVTDLSVSASAEDRKITLDMPDDFKEDLFPVMEKDIIHSVVVYAAARHLKMLAPSVAETIMADYTSAIARINSNSYIRKMPSVKTDWPEVQG